MKKFILSCALFTALTNVHSTHTVDLNDTVAANSYQFFKDLKAGRSAISSEYLKWMAVIRLCPISSILGALYLGGTSYQILSEVESFLNYQNPTLLNKLSPKARKALKIVVSSLFATLGAWCVARSYQGLAAGNFPLSSVE